MSAITCDLGVPVDSRTLHPLPYLNPEKYRLTRFNPGDTPLQSQILRSVMSVVSVVRTLPPGLQCWQLADYGNLVIIISPPPSPCIPLHPRSSQIGVVSRCSRHGRRLSLRSASIRGMPSSSFASSASFCGEKFLRHGSGPFPGFIRHQILLKFESGEIDQV